MLNIISTININLHNVGQYMKPKGLTLYPPKISINDVRILGFYCHFYLIYFNLLFMVQTRSIQFLLQIQHSKQAIQLPLG